MQDWSDGYVTGIEYSFGYHRELNPSVLSFALLSQGYHAPIESEPLNYCELGCGQGLATNLLAAANPNISFYANDFNPRHIVSAKRLAKESGIDNVHFYDEAFEEFAAENSLPRSFDIISLHGVFSWISAKNREHILNFVRKKLAPGGLLYVSYNSFPGWAPFLPIRHLLINRAAAHPEPLERQINNALSMLNKIPDIAPDYIKQNPRCIELIDQIKTKRISYLAHEYFNEDWSAFHFEEVAKLLSSAKLEYAASAHLLDHVDVINLLPEQSAFIAREQDRLRREGLRDFFINQQFRRDIFVKGTEKHTLLSARDSWSNTRFVLSVRRQDVPSTIKSRLGEIVLQPSVYEPILDGFKDGPILLSKVLEIPAVQELGWAKLQQAMILLVGANYLQPCLTEKDGNKRRKITSNVNKNIIIRSRYSGDICYLVSPLTGGGYPLSRVELLFLDAISSGEKSSRDWASYTWSILKQQGDKLFKADKALVTEEEILAELSDQADVFADRKLPVLEKLQIFLM